MSTASLGNTSLLSSQRSPPQKKKLTANGVEQKKLRHTLNGGGRVGTEYEWFNLREIEFI